MSKVSDKKEKKRAALLEAAFKLFTTKGILRTSISDIVEDAGVAKGTFYLYFEDKYDIGKQLVFQRISKIFKTATEAVQKINILDFEDKVIFLCDNILAQMKEDRDLLKFVTKVMDWNVFKKSIIETQRDEGFNFLGEYDRVVLHSQKVKIEEPEIMMFLILEFLSSVCCSPLLYNDPADIETLKPYIYRTIKDIIKRHAVVIEEKEV